MMTTTHRTCGKKGFDAWEDATARYAEQVLRSARFTPSGSMFTALMRAEGGDGQARRRLVERLGPPEPAATRSARSHALNQIPEPPRRHRGGSPTSGRRSTEPRPARAWHDRAENRYPMDVTPFLELMTAPGYYSRWLDAP